MSSRKFERIGAHSHSKGLGLKNGKALQIADGLVGQIEAREAAGIVVQLVREGKMAGRGVLLVGPPGTGKTAIAIAMAKELGEDVPFVAISGSEIYSAEMKKTEVLTRAMRRAIGVRRREVRKVYEGVVSDLNIRMTRHPYNPFQQVPEGAKIVLKTKAESRALHVDENVAKELIAKQINVGDVVMIDAETGKITKIGRCVESGGEVLDIVVEQKVSMPDGPTAKEREFVHTVTLHDLDVMNARSGSLFSLLFGVEDREISSEVRQRVDESVKRWVDTGRAEILPGVLFIDDVHMLDIEAFSFLGRAMESELAPIIVLATNRGVTKVRGTDIEAPHGIPLDILDRLLIIKTKPYSRDEIKEILKIRAKEEGIELSEEALEKLTSLGEEYSLRYATQLLSPAATKARNSGKKVVEVDDVLSVQSLFVDVKQSSAYLKEMEEKMLK
ncbi:MAG: TATA box-binding protein [Candidatus Methanomethylicota archaeon]|uniref:DNA helicase n=1 Tax=Thermoproteota archaeon TaxID=2056631 RepID=A0A497F4F2_9CREN|nr:MAG: TATA box-binding protein [Candidatus Verstraetearchaeota archaeon]